MFPEYNYSQKHMEAFNWNRVNANASKKKQVKFSKVRDTVPSKTAKDIRFRSDVKYKSFGAYLKAVLKTSLITSFPEIAASKSWVKRIIKIIVFILCLIGFAYQAMDFLRMFLAYPTVVNVLISNPYEIVQPAITICNKNRKRRSVVCTRPFNQCVFLEAKKFCSIYPQYCPERNPNKAFTGMPYLNDLMDYSYDWYYTYEESHNESMITGCKMELQEERWTCRDNYRRVPVVDGKGDPNCCFTIESLVGRPEEEDSLHPNTLVIELSLNTEPEEYAMSSVPVMIQIKIHDRRAVVNPFSDGFSLEGGMQYNAYVSMQTQEMLPSPYDTHCVNYIESWRENNGTGPLNHLMCVEKCQLNMLLEQGQCIDKNVDYAHEEELCRKSVRSLTSDIVKNCTIQCENACYDAQYEVRYEKLGNMDSTCMVNDTWCTRARIKLSILFNKFRLTRYVYQPKFASVEMFSYVGGYMGMWLGLSLISLFDLFETFCFLLYYPIGHMRHTRKKRVKPAPELQRNFYSRTFY